MARRHRRGEGTVYRDKAASAKAGRPVWVAVVSLGFRDGRRIRHKAHATTSKLADRELEKLQRLYGSSPDLTTATLDRYLGDWLVGAKPTIAPSTYRSYAGHVRMHISPLLGGIVVAKLRPADVRRLIADRLRAGLSPATVIRIVTSLRIALGTGRRDGTLSENVASEIGLPRVDRDPIPAMTVARAQAILGAVRGDPFEALYVLLLGSGLRLGEALGLDWRDVELEAGTVSVRKGKTRRSVRTIPVPPFVVAGLRAQKAAAKRFGPEVPVFLGPRSSERLRGDSVLHHWQRLLTAAGLPAMRLHDLRHGHATLLLAAGVPMRAIADQLGHANPATTANVYAHVSQDHLRDAVATLERIALPNGSNVGSAGS
jgi:integrase